MANRYRADVNAEGPLGQLKSAQELLTYYHLQLIIVEGLLRGRFFSSQGKMLDFSFDENPVDQLQKYSLRLKKAGVPEQLVTLFTHEMAMLFFTKLLLLQKIAKIMRGNCTDTLKCTCV